MFLTRSGCNQILFPLKPGSIWDVRTAASCALSWGTARCSSSLTLPSSLPSRPAHPQPQAPRQWRAQDIGAGALPSPGPEPHGIHILFGHPALRCPVSWCRVGTQSPSPPSNPGDLGSPPPLPLALPSVRVGTISPCFFLAKISGRWMWISYKTERGGDQTVNLPSTMCLCHVPSPFVSLNET